MSTVETTITALTPEIFKGEILLSVTAAGQSIQLLHTAKSKLVMNEDNLPQIKEYLDNCDKISKIVETERVQKKQPFLDNGRAVDAGAKLLSTEIDAAKKDVYATYSKLCAEVERKKVEATKEEIRVATIRSTMSTFKTDMAVKVAAAEKYSELVALERLLNLQTANKAKFSEFLEEFKDNVKDITSLIAAKKEAAREREGLSENGQEGAENKPDEQILEEMDRKEELDTKIAELNTKIVHTAVNQSTKPTESVTQVFANVPKGSRKYYRWEIIDEAAAVKKGWAKETVVPESELIDTFLNENKNKVVDETGIIEGGVRFFQIKKY